MEEVDLQKEVIKSVISAGGYGHKLSNRFITGVADLLIKLPDCVATVLEVKFGRYVVPLRAPKIAVEITSPQARFLRGYHNAGMVVGLLSFAGLNHKNMWAAVIWFDQLNLYSESNSVGLHTKLHVPLGIYHKLDPRTPEFLQYLKSTMWRESDVQRY